MEYRDFRVSTFDAHVPLTPCRDAWLVRAAVTRDSPTAEHARFERTLARLGGPSVTTEVHRLRHWGVGWVDLVLTQPKSAKPR